MPTDSGPRIPPPVSDRYGCRRRRTSAQRHRPCGWSGRCVPSASGWGRDRGWSWSRSSAPYPCSPRPAGPGWRCPSWWRNPGRAHRSARCPRWRCRCRRRSRFSRGWWPRTPDRPPGGCRPRRPGRRRSCAHPWAALRRSRCWRSSRRSAARGRAAGSSCWPASDRPATCCWCPPRGTRCWRRWRRWCCSLRRGPAP